MTDERIIISAPAQMAALKTIYDHCRPGHRPDWDFNQPGQASLPDDGAARIKDGRLASLRLPRSAFKPEALKGNFLFSALEGGFKIQLEIQGTRRRKIRKVDEKALLTNPAEVAAFKDFCKVNGLKNSSCWTFMKDGSICGYDDHLEVKDGHLVSLLSRGIDWETRDLRPLAGLTRLTTLELWNNETHDLRSLANLLNLKGLNLLGPIKSFEPLAPLINLNSLILQECQGRQVSDLNPLAGLKRLKHLCLCGSRPIRPGHQGHQAVDLTPLVGLKRLKHLALHSLFVKNIKPLADMNSLASLALDDNPISDISPLANLTNLKYLSLARTKIKDLTPLADFKSLTGLDLSGNQLGDLSPLTRLINLTSLESNNNNIKDLTPLAGLTSLKDLHFSDNKVSDLSPLKDLKNLKSLWLYNNKQISDLSPLAALTDLKTLYFGETRVRDLAPLLSFLASLDLLVIVSKEIKELNQITTIKFKNDSEISLSKSQDGLELEINGYGWWAPRSLF